MHRFIPQRCEAEPPDGVQFAFPQRESCLQSRGAQVWISSSLRPGTQSSERAAGADRALSRAVRACPTPGQRGAALPPRGSPAGRRRGRSLAGSPVRGWQKGPRAAAVPLQGAQGARLAAAAAAAGRLPRGTRHTPRRLQENAGGGRPRRAAVALRLRAASAPCLPAPGTLGGSASLGRASSSAAVRTLRDASFPPNMAAGAGRR